MNRTRAKALIAAYEDALVAYHTTPGISFRHLPGWQESSWNTQAVSEVIQAIKKRAL